MGVTTTVKNGVTSAAMQITDLQGHTVTTVTLAGTNTDYSSWADYDSFGNPLNPQTNTNLINYSAYGQQERATNTTGLILMGARVYNPETNQFTSIDPIPGGNENRYAYPNDPINHADYSGLWDWLWDTLDVTVTVLSFVPIPVLEQAAWIGKAILVGGKVARAAKGLLTFTKVQKVEQASVVALPKVEGIYEFYVNKKWYVGQTNNLERRLSEHRRSWGKQGNKIEKVIFTELPGSTALERRLLEQGRIDELGLSNLHNIRNAVRKP
jgi:RHS repeat-associated protein